MAERSCRALNEGGEPCRQRPLDGADYCFWHSPEHAEEAAEARRLGGLRRRKEKIAGAAYEFEGLGSTAGIRRLLEIATTDTLALENSVARSRTLAYLAMAGMRLLEAGELEGRLQALEEGFGVRAIRGRR